MQKELDKCYERLFKIKKITLWCKEFVQ